MQADTLTVVPNVTCCLTSTPVFDLPAIRAPVCCSASQALLQYAISTSAAAKAAAGTQQQQQQQQQSDPGVLLLQQLHVGEGFDAEQVRRSIVCTLKHASPAHLSLTGFKVWQQGNLPCTHTKGRCSSITQYTASFKGICHLSHPESFTCICAVCWWKVSYASHMCSVSPNSHTHHTLCIAP